MGRFWRISSGVILWLGLVACMPSVETTTETAVGQNSAIATLATTNVAPVFSPTPSPTSLPDPTATQSLTSTAEATATQPKFTPIAPFTHSFLRSAAVLPDEPLGNLIDFRSSADDPDTLILVTSAQYFRINAASGAVTAVSAPPQTRIIGVDDTNTLWLLPENNPETIFSLDQAGVQQTFGAESGWLPLVGTAKDLVQDASGDIWLSTNEDVRRFSGLEWTIYTREALGMAAPLMEDVGTMFRLVYAPLTDTVWVGECDWAGPGPNGGGGVRWFDGTVWQGNDSPAAQGCARDIAEAGNGRIWIAVDNHLWHFSPADSSWEQFTPPNPDENLRIGYTEKLILDSYGNPWPLFSLCGGASCQVAFIPYRLRDGVWSPFGEPIFDPPILVFNSNNLPFFFQQSQLLAYTLNDEPLPFTDFALTTFAVFLDEADELWVVGRPSEDMPFVLWRATMRD